MAISPENLLPLLGGGPFGTFGYGGTGFTVTQDEAPVTVETVTTQEGLRRADAGSAFGGMLSPLPPYDGYAGPNIYGCPGGFGGFDPAPPLSVPIMWAMRATPAIVLASAYLTFAPALSAGWSIEIADDGGDKQLAEAVKAAAAQDLLPIWDRALPGALESLHFATWLQEIVWGRREDRGGTGGSEDAAPGSKGGARVIPVDVRPVLPMEATVHRDPYLRFAGFQIGSNFRGPAYAFLAVNQPHVDPVRGYSRNQNALKDWWRAIQSERNADRIERKASGIHMMLGVPNATLQSADASGNVTTVSGLQMAQRIADQAARANVFTVPRMYFSKEAIQANPELAKVPAISVEQFDWGNIGEALSSHLKRLDRLEVNMVRAWHHGEREGMEAEHGSRADATAHKSGGVLDVEGVRKMLARQWDDQVGLTWQRQNFPQWQGRFITKPAPLADPIQAYLQTITQALLSGAATGPDTELELDKRALLDRTSLPLRPADVVEKDRAEQDAQKAQQQKAALNAPPAVNGNVNGNGRAKTSPRVAEALKRFGRNGN